MKPKYLFISNTEFFLYCTRIMIFAYSQMRFCGPTSHLPPPRCQKCENFEKNHEPGRPLGILNNRYRALGATLGHLEVKNLKIFEIER